MDKTSDFGIPEGLVSRLRTRFETTELTEEKFIRIGITQNASTNTSIEDKSVPKRPHRITNAIRREGDHSLFRIIVLNLPGIKGIRHLKNRVFINKNKETEKKLKNASEPLINRIRNEFADTGGIFRISGSAIKIKSFKTEPSFSINDIEDPHLLAGALKLILRECYSLKGEAASQFIAISELNEEDRIPSLKKIIQSLPEDQAKFFNELTGLCKLISDTQGKNRNNEQPMNLTNLSISISPNMVARCRKTLPEQVSELSKIEEAFTLMCEHHDEIFKEQGG